MFLDFFLLLRNRGIPVSLSEYLALLEALNKGAIGHSVDEFYYLCRTALIKNEENLDAFDQLFGHFFKGMTDLPDELIYNIPEEWLRKEGNRIFTPEEMEQIKAMGGLEAVLKRLEELLKEQKERHQGGNRWIGTGGTSPFGAHGYNPEGVRIGQNSSRHRSAIKVWDKRHFKDLKDDVELETRHLKMALRKLRQITREGLAEELDLSKTIQRTSENAGFLEIHMRPERKNNIKILLLLDIGGSMDDHIELCSRLFSAAKYEFKHLDFYYFHNCIYEGLWKDNTRRWSETIPTYEVLNKYNSDYKVIFVGDAMMSPYEILSKHGSVEHYNEEAGIVWLERFKQQFPNMVWLNPVPKQSWGYVHSIKILREFMNDQMYPLTVQGIDEAVKRLSS